MSKLKVENSTTGGGGDINYPCLKISTHTNNIYLMSSPTTGVVLQLGNIDYVSARWAIGEITGEATYKGYLKVYKGSVTLTQD